MVRSLLAAGLLILVLPWTAPRAQCTVTQVTFGSYGTGCNRVFPQQVPSLTGTWNAPSCSVDLALGAFGGCCNTFLRARVLILGVNASWLPLPWAGMGCMLLAAPDVVFALPMTGTQVHLPLPPGIPRTTLFAQAMAVYFTTLGMTTDLAFSGGATLTIR